MKRMQSTHRFIAITLSALFIASALSGCSILDEQAQKLANNESETTKQTAEERETLVLEGKVGRYFENIKDDPASLSVFVSHLPKGGDVRVMPAEFVAASKLVVSAKEAKNANSSSGANTGLDGAPQNAAETTEPVIKKGEYRTLITQAITQRVTYLEIVANVTPELIKQLDATKSQVTKDYERTSFNTNITVNFLAAVSTDLNVTEFSQELDAAFALYEQSERVVGIVVLAPTTKEGFDNFTLHMDTLDTFYRSLGWEPPKEKVEIRAADADAEKIDADNADDKKTAEKSDDTKATTEADAKATSETEETAKTEDDAEANEAEAETEETEEQSKYPPLAISLDGRLFAQQDEVYVSYHFAAALEQGHASRIDFGTPVLFEPNAYSLLRRMAKSKVGVCLASSSGSGNATNLDTYQLFSSAGIPVSLISNHPNGAQLNCNASYLEMAQKHNLSYRELKALSYHALDVAFLSKDERARLYELLDKAFASFEQDVALTIDDLGLLKKTAQ